MAYFNGYNFGSSLDINTSSSIGKGNKDKSNVLNDTTLFSKDPFSHSSEEPELAENEKTQQVEEDVEKTEQPLVISQELADRLEEIEKQEVCSYPYTASTVNVDEEGNMTKNPQGECIGPIFTTGYVGKVLGYTPQQIRNVTKIFYDYLNISRAPGGAVEYTMESIAQLKSIFCIKQQQNLTFEQTKAYIESGGKDFFGRDFQTQQMEKLLEYTAEKMNESVKDALDDYMEGIKEALISGMNNMQDTMKMAITEQNEKNTLVLEEKNIREREELQGIIEKQSSQLEKMTATLQERDYQLEQMAKNQEKLIQQMTEQLEKQNEALSKKPFWKKIF